MRRVAVFAAVVVGIVCAPVRVHAATPGCPQWRATALEAGWSEQEWPRLERIIWRESRCNPDAFNGRRRDRSIGLVQVNVKGRLLAHRRAVCGIDEPAELFDPYTNLACAEAIHEQAGWQPWQ